MPVLDLFGFNALWSPYFGGALVAVLFGYFLLTVKFRKQFSNSEPLTQSQAVIFTSGIILLYIFKGSPIDLLGHIMFSVHMVQMAFLFLIIPPILIVGTPNWIWRKIFKSNGMKRILSFFTHPLIALILFNGVFSFYHIPMIFDFIKTDMWLHAGYTSVLFVIAMFMWWPLVNRLSEYQSLNGIKKVGYIFANGILLTPACALIIFADTPMYLTYSDPRAWADALSLCVPSTTLSGLNLTGPEMLNSLPLIDDQQLGGVVMKIIQEIVYGIVLAQVFFKWYKDEQQIDPYEQIPLLQPNLLK